MYKNNKKENGERKYRSGEKTGSARRMSDYTREVNEKNFPHDSIQTDENIIYGRNAVIEALKSDRDIEKIFIRRNDREGSLRVIAALASEKGIPFVDISQERLDEITAKGAHQGVAALACCVEYLSIDELIKETENKNEPAFFVVCDEISDPHNFGAIIRSAVCCGANGIIVPKRRSAPLSAVAVKASAGAVNYMKFAKVANIASAIDKLKEHGIWVYGADASGTSLWSSDMRGPIAVVLGNEGDGLSRLVKEKCDFLVSIPMYGPIDSFNVSCAASVILAGAAKQRNS